MSGGVTRGAVIDGQKQEIETMQLLLDYWSPRKGASMNMTTSLNVIEMACGHCVSVVTRDARQLGACGTI